MTENHEWKTRNQIFQFMGLPIRPFPASRDATPKSITNLRASVGFRPHRYPDEEDSNSDLEDYHRPHNHHHHLPTPPQPETAEDPKGKRAYNLRIRKKKVNKHNVIDPNIEDEEDLECGFFPKQACKGMVHNVPETNIQSPLQQHDNGKAKKLDESDSDFEFCVPPPPKQHDDGLSFDDIGGLSQHLDGLKEMVVIPILYPELFAKFNITPPRGVLFCGPPGTGKTLTARVLASTVSSKAGREVKFYMRKGADLLSKWAGESEKQLAELFEDARKNQPSIIFFDEIDGLCPARSSNQGDQVYNSIVSTLLALMDGLDSRGQVIVIGATNRVDSIDGALRRPGRFDREFTFTLPDIKARVEILNIYSRKMDHPLSDELKLELATRCLGYSGADLKALFTEAVFRAFREMYPQVYRSDTKIDIDVNSIRVEKHHFFGAMSTITPAARRDVN